MEDNLSLGAGLTRRCLMNNSRFESTQSPVPCKYQWENGVLKLRSQCLGNSPPSGVSFEVEFVDISKSNEDEVDTPAIDLHDLQVSDPLRTQSETESGSDTEEAPDNRKLQMYGCLICDYKTSVEQALTTHSRTHSGVKPFSCDRCNYKATTATNLKYHTRIHTGEKPHSCRMCKYTCITKSALKLHLRTHSGEKPFSCGICPYRSTTSSNLRSHERIHNGERPYACRQCNYKSSSSSNLKSHMKLRHDMQ